GCPAPRKATTHYPGSNGHPLNRASSATRSCIAYSCWALSCSSRVFRATKQADGTPGVIIPGDPERQAEAERFAKGVPLHPVVVEELRDISDRTGIPFD